MFNIVVLTGRLTADPELKTTQSGLSVTSFSIAVDRRFGSGEERQTDFIFVESKRDSASAGNAPAGNSEPTRSYSNAGSNDFAELGDMSDDDLPF